MKHQSSPVQSRNPYLKLLLAFTSWKLILFGLALLTPSPAYDTSTSLILRPSQSVSVWPLIGRLCEKLTRWDAIYFVKAAERGYINEQEWAFGWGFVQIVSGVERALSFMGVNFGLETPFLHAFSGILIANASHFLSTLMLYKTTLLVFKAPVGKAENMAFLTACLHILSPAGLFLSAPYSESLFSLLSFIGTFLYLWAGQKKLDGRGAFLRNTAILTSAIVFSASCLVRSNGLLHGLLFLYDFLYQIASMITEASREPRRLLAQLLQIGVLGVGGLIIGVGIVIPQIIAWRDYCTEGDIRPWCSNIFPSIYFWVQDYYWNVGMFRYWTLPNIPLFLLAAPMLSIMIISGKWGVGIVDKINTQSLVFEEALVRKLALLQLLLAVMAIVSYHVQIITRLSSGYMVWYWWVAYQMSTRGKGKEGTKQEDWTKWIVRYMVLYGVVQGVLFAGFLPPA